MIRQSFIRVGAAAAVLALASCGGEKTVEDVKTCQAINNSVYFTDTLEDGGPTQNGIAKMHWRASFKDYQVSFMQSDFGLAGTYSCEYGEVLVDMGDGPTQALKFSADMQQFKFNPLAGEAKTYVKSATETLTDNSQACALVAGHRYLEVPAIGAVSDGEGLPFGSLMYEFSEGQQVDYLVGGDAMVRGIYDCSLGELHVHGAANDTQPQRVQVKDKGETIVVELAPGSSVTLVRDGGGSYCTDIFEPVCAIKRENIQCITAPCPIGFYKTYGNACYAGNDRAEIVAEGECGEREGKPAFDEPVACDDVYSPVCAAATSSELCTSMPCPAVKLKTFSNKCQASAVQAPVILEQACDRREGEAVTEIEGACPAVVDPICAKTTTEVVCVTEPCPSHEYKTFNNSCVASLALASEVFDEACGKLDGQLAFDQPPIKVVEGLPSTSKSVRVTSVKLDNDLLNVTIAYSGCDQQYFQLYASELVLESYPPQVETAFIPMVEDECEAVFTSDLSFDLKPLIFKLQQMYPGEDQRVILRDLNLELNF